MTTNTILIYLTTVDTVKNCISNLLIQFEIKSNNLYLNLSNFVIILILSNLRLRRVQLLINLTLNKNKLKETFRTHLPIIKFILMNSDD